MSVLSEVLAADVSESACCGDGTAWIRRQRWTAVAALSLIGAVSTVAVLVTRDDTQQLMGTGPPQDDGTPSV